VHLEKECDCQFPIIGVLSLHEEEVEMMFHYCPDDFALFMVARDHAHCLVCWTRLAAGWIWCKLTHGGH
jgi:hypothetical protein